MSRDDFRTNEINVAEALTIVADASASLLKEFESLRKEIRLLRQEIADLSTQSVRRPLLSKREAAEHLSISVASLDNLIGAGAIPVVRLTGPSSYPRFRADDLDAFIASRVTQLEVDDD